MEIRKYFLIGMIVVLTGCAGGAREFSNRPTPILCEQAVSLSPIYLYYDELMSELNKRGADCADFVGNTKTIKLR